MAFPLGFVWNAASRAALNQVRSVYGSTNTKKVKQAALQKFERLLPGLVSAEMIEKEIIAMVAKDGRLAKNRSAATVSAAAAAVRQPSAGTSQTPATSVAGGSNQPASLAAPFVAPLSALEQCLRAGQARSAEQTAASLRLLQGNETTTAAQRVLLEQEQAKKHQAFHRWKASIFHHFYTLAAEFPGAHLFFSISSPHGDMMQTWSDSRGGGWNDPRMLAALNRAMQDLRTMGDQMVAAGEVCPDPERRALVDGKFVKGRTILVRLGCFTVLQCFLYRINCRTVNCLT